MNVDTIAKPKEQLVHRSSRCTNPQLEAVDEIIVGIGYNAQDSRLPEQRIKQPFAITPDGCVGFFPSRTGKPGRGGGVQGEDLKECGGGGGLASAAGMAWIGLTMPSNPRLELRSRHRKGEAQ